MKISEEAKREYINEGTVARAVRGKLGWLDEGFGLGQVGCRYFHQRTYSRQSSNVGENSDTYWAG